MTKDQTTKFNKMFETTMNWGDGENCIGLFVGLLGSDVDQESHDLYYLTTCVDNGKIEILEFDGSGYYDYVADIPVNSKTKSVMKEAVECLLAGGSFTDLRILLN